MDIVVPPVSRSCKEIRLLSYINGDDDGDVDCYGDGNGNGDGDGDGDVGTNDYWLW